MLNKFDYFLNNDVYTIGGIHDAITQNFWSAFSESISSDKELDKEVQKELDKKLVNNLSTLLFAALSIDEKFTDKLWKNMPWKYYSLVCIPLKPFGYGTKQNFVDAINSFRDAIEYGVIASIEEAESTETTDKFIVEDKLDLSKKEQIEDFFVNSKVDIQKLISKVYIRFLEEGSKKFLEGDFRVIRFLQNAAKNIFYNQIPENIREKYEWNSAFIISSFLSFSDEDILKIWKNLPYKYYPFVYWPAKFAGVGKAEQILKIYKGYVDSFKGDENYAGVEISRSFEEEKFDALHRVFVSKIGEAKQDFAEVIKELILEAESLDMKKSSYEIEIVPEFDDGKKVLNGYLDIIAINPTLFMSI